MRRDKDESRLDNKNRNIEKYLNKKLDVSKDNGKTSISTQFNTLTT